jgi:hypothetical protein
MNKKDLEVKIKEIDILFNRLQEETGILPIPDGIVDLDAYLESDLKIMWILKEANSSDHDNESDWDYPNELKSFYEKEKYENKWDKTFNSIICTTYGILNEKKWDEINKDFSKEVLSALKNIAFVNIKKIPGGSRAVNAELKDFYSKHPSLIHKQIEYYEPNVIICAGTWDILDDFFGEYLGSECEIVKIDEFKTTFYKYKDKILVYTYHPQNISIPKEKYSNTIIDNVLEWKYNYRKK